MCEEFYLHGTTHEQLSCYLLELLDNEASRSSDVDIPSHGLDAGPLGNQDFGQRQRLNGWHLQLRNTWKERKATLWWIV